MCMCITMWASVYRHVHVHIPLPLWICLNLFISLVTTGIYIWFIRWYRAILYTLISTPCTQETSLKPSPLSPRVFLPCYLCIHMYVTLCSYVYSHTRVALVLQRGSAPMNLFVGISVCFYIFTLSCAHGTMYTCMFPRVCRCMWIDSHLGMWIPMHIFGRYTQVNMHLVIVSGCII